MRKAWGCIAVLGLLFCPCWAEAAGTTIEQARTEVVQQVGLVKACGEVLLGRAVGDVKGQAVADAERRAVKKALGRFIPASESEGSLYKQLLGNYRRYVQGKTRLLKTEKIGGKYLAYCEVAVDFGGISRDLKSRVRQQQERHDTEEAAFFVRLSSQPGLLPEQQASLLPAAVLEKFEYNFTESGFSASVADQSDEVARLLQSSSASLELADYKHRVRESLPLEVGLYVVGEIRLTKVYEGYAEAVCDVQAVRQGETAEKDEVLCSFTQIYGSSGANIQEAVEHVVKKAAFDAARQLAHSTYSAWSAQKQPANKQGVW